MSCMLHQADLVVLQDAGQQWIVPRDAFQASNEDFGQEVRNSLVAACWVPNTLLICALQFRK